MRIVPLIVLAIALALAVAWAWRWTTVAPPPNPLDAGRAAISGEFSLVDHTGRAVTDQDYRGKWRLMFFGYTHCPDVCPTVLNDVAGVMAALGRDAARVRPLFVTVDPERDTARVMADYVAAFDPRIVGLTGTPDQVRAAAGAFRVYYAKVPDEDDPGDYLMDHSAHLYLMNPDGRFEAVFSFRDDIDKIAAAIRSRL